MKKGLRQIEINVLVNALREGLSWEEAKKRLPKGIDLKAIDSFKDGCEAEAKKARPVEKVSTTITPDELLALRQKADLAEKLNADLAQLRKENEDLQAKLDVLQKPKR